eukprot:364557-Chlamydomonas_euryale.AAC.30
MNVVYGRGSRGAAHSAYKQASSAAVSACSKRGRERDREQGVPYTENPRGQGCVTRSRATHAMYCMHGCMSAAYTQTEYASIGMHMKRIHATKQKHTCYEKLLCSSPLSTNKPCISRGSCIVP